MSDMKIAADMQAMMDWSQTRHRGSIASMMEELDQEDAKRKLTKAATVTTATQVGQKRS